MLKYTSVAKQIENEWIVWTLLQDIVPILAFLLLGSISMSSWHIYSFLQIYYSVLSPLWYRVTNPIFPLAVLWALQHERKASHQDQSCRFELTRYHWITKLISLWVQRLTHQRLGWSGMQRQMEKERGFSSTHHCLWHLQRPLTGSLRRDELWLHLNPMIALWAEYNGCLRKHWSDCTL